MFLQQQQQQLKQPLPPHAFHFLNQPDFLYEKIIRNPVGANPRDINNPLSINQLTKRDYVNNAPVALSPSTLHHLMGVSASASTPLAAQGPTGHPSQLFGGAGLNASAVQPDFHHFSLQQELLNHHQQQHNSISGRTNQSSPSALSYQTHALAISQHLQSRAFAASAMSAQHPYSHAHNHPAFSVTPDAAAVAAAVQQPPSTSAVAAGNARRCVSEDSSGGAISVT